LKKKFFYFGDILLEQQMILSFVF